MFRTLGKSKIAFVLAILFAISLFFFRSSSRYSNIFNSDNIVASVSGTPISTTKFNRTLLMNINQFNQMLGKTLSREEIKAFKIQSLALGALINDAVFENEYDKRGFKIDKTVIAQKTKERIPQLYKNNKLNDKFLNEFLQQQQLKIEDIVQIIDFETRNQIFNETFFNISYPKNFSKKIYRYDNHERKVEHIQIPLELINIEKTIKSNITNIDKVLEEFYEKNLEKYMSEEKRNVDYIVVNINDYINDFIPSDFEISEYYYNNKDLYFENEKRSFIQFNFKSLDEARKFKTKISDLNKTKDIIVYAKNNNIKFNSFENLSSDEVLEEIANVLFKLRVEQYSEIIETTIAKHIILLQNIKTESQLQLEVVENDIKETITKIEVNNYFNELNNNIAASILEGNSLHNIATEFQLKLKTLNKLTKNYEDFENEQKVFFESLITNAFATNKDFVNDIITINPNLFYIFNVTEIESSLPFDLIEIKEIVTKDWKTSKRIEIIEKQIKENKSNLNFLKELSSLYNLPIKELEINKNSQVLPRNLILEIFEGVKDTNIHKLERSNMHLVKIVNIKIPNNNDKNEEISLMNNLRSSFNNELIKNVKISTNDRVINAVIDRY